MELKANWYQIGFTELFEDQGQSRGFRGKLPRSCKIITTLWENLATYYTFTSYIFHRFCSANATKTEKHSVVYFP